MANFTNRVTVEFTKGEMTFWDERGYTEDNIPDVFFATATVFDKDTGEQGEIQLEIHEGEIIEVWEGKNFNDAMLDEQRLEQIFAALCFYESEGRYETDFEIDWQVEIGNTMTATFNFKETV